VSLCVHADKAVQRKQAEGWGFGCQLAVTKCANTTNRDGQEAERGQAAVGVWKREGGSVGMGM
jgi:hypothetical protein